MNLRTGLLIVGVVFLALLLCGIINLVRPSGPATPSTPTPALAASTPIPAAPTAGSTTTSLDVNVFQSWVVQTANDQLPGSLIDKIGAFCDVNPSACVFSQTGNWHVNGPAVLVTDPIGVSMTSYRWQVVKTYQMNDTYWGVYYCAVSCFSPKPGRAALLSSPLP